MITELIQSLPSLPAVPSMPSLPSLGSIPKVVWFALGLFLLPFAILFGAIGVKLLWSLWPIPLSVGAAGYAIYRLGIDFFWLIALGIAGGIVLTWLWQRTSLFLKGDRRLEKMMFLGD